ncbi:MAG: CapA family protein [Clostridia bacterium]|nr:CapA family protein [Clostridia bacterium]
MKNADGTAKRKLSAGTKCMLILTAVVLIGSALVLGKLSSGAKIDLSKLRMDVLDLQEDPSRNTEEPAENKGESETKPPVKISQAAVAETPVRQNKEASYTLTVGGSISLSGEVRKNSRSTDAKVADYADIMMLLAPRIRSDVNAVFFENILSDRHKVSDTVAPGQAATLLTEAGFDIAACGFSQAYSGGRDGVEATLISLDSRGITALGIRYADYTGTPEIRTVNGVKTAFLQYTATVLAKTRNAMAKENTGSMVPEAEAELITQDITAARREGAEAVIIFLSWGKTGNKDPDKKQRELAAKIAAAGADLIVGSGSHVPQTAEYLPGAGGKSVLCIWSLGTLLSGDRSNIKRISGYLLHVTVRSDGLGGVKVLDPEYTPVYTWKYKQDGRFYYRCIVSGGAAPDGMDSEQRKQMAKSAETVENVLKDAPLSERAETDDP